MPFPHLGAAPKRPILYRVKKVNRNLLKDWIMKVNAFLKEIISGNITETNRLTRACVIFVGKKVGLKPNQRRANAVKEPWWKRRIKQSVQELQKHINILQRKKRGEIKKERDIRRNKTQIWSQKERIKCSSRRAKTKDTD